MTYSLAWDIQFKHNSAFILPYVLDENVICTTPCLKSVDVEELGNDMYINMYFTPNSKQQYYWLLNRARENASYINNFQSNIDGNIYTVVVFSIPSNIQWAAKMIMNTDYSKLDKTNIITAVLFWKQYIYKIIEKEETRAARDEQSGFIF